MDTSPLARANKAFRQFKQASTQVVDYWREVAALDDKMVNAAAHRLEASAVAALSVCSELEAVRWTSQAGPDPEVFVPYFDCPHSRGLNTDAFDWLTHHPAASDIFTLEWIPPDETEGGVSPRVLGATGMEFEWLDRAGHILGINDVDLDGSGSIESREWRIDGEMLHFLRLGIDWSNTEAREMIGRLNNWLSLKPDSPEVRLILKTHPNVD